MKILALGAHPDDIEIFMYGLLAIYKNSGNQINIIIATDGSKGGNVDENVLKKKRKNEAIEGLKNLSIPVFLEIPDGELGDDPEHKKVIKKNILDIMPDLIITHSEDDYHSDHRSLSKLVRNSVSHYIPILYCDTLMGVNFHPSYYIDITNYFEMKKKAILCHQSQNPKRFVELSKLMNSFRAAQCNSPKGTYAEGYKYYSSFPFTDINLILPASLKLRPFNIESQNGFL